MAGTGRTQERPPGRGQGTSDEGTKEQQPGDNGAAAKGERLSRGGGGGVYSPVSVGDEEVPNPGGDILRDSGPKRRQYNGGLPSRQ